jgi:hypothetical protein
LVTVSQLQGGEALLLMMKLRRTLKVQLQGALIELVALKVELVTGKF